MAPIGVAPAIRLGGTEAYAVETPDGAVGTVEEVWLDPDDRPRAVAVRTRDGRRGLLLADQVRAVDREHHWIVAQPHPVLLELDAPRLAAGGDAAGSRIAATWSTTGSPLAPPAPGRRLPRLRARTDASPSPRTEAPDRPLWQTIAFLYGWLALFLAFMLALAFLIPLLVEGSAY